MWGAIANSLYNAREEYLEAKRRFEECRDGWIPHLDQSQEEHEKELVQLMFAMDLCEDAYKRTIGEKDSMSIMELRDGFEGGLYEEVMGHPYEEKPLPELMHIADLARLEYEEMRDEGKDNFMTDEEYDSKLQILQLRWELAEADCWYVNSREQQKIEDNHFWDYYEELKYKK